MIYIRSSTGTIGGGVGIGVRLDEDLPVIGIVGAGFVAGATVGFDLGIGTIGVVGIIRVGVVDEVKVPDEGETLLVVVVFGSRESVSSITRALWIGACG